MCDTAISYHSHTESEAKSPLSIYASSDPTRTLMLRRAFAKEMRKRFTIVQRMIRDAIVVKDVFGLTDRVPTLQDNVDSNLRPKQFDFARSDQKIAAFMEWLEDLVDNEILSVRDRRRIGQSIEQAWSNVFIEDSYKRGVIRGANELGKIQYPDLISIEDRGGIAAVMGGPMHADRLGVLYTRVFTDLKGITDAMDTQISRVLALGLADGDNPRLLARKLVATIDGKNLGSLNLTDSLGRFIPAKRRAEILARTEVIRAHHQGMVQEYQNWGLEGVRVMAELRTAGDNRVCSVCAGLEGNFFTLEEARDLIPVHPQCRCIVLPARAQDYAPRQAAAAESEADLDNLAEIHHTDYKAFKAEYRDYFRTNPDGIDWDEVREWTSYGDTGGKHGVAEWHRIVNAKAQSDFKSVKYAMDDWILDTNQDAPVALKQMAAYAEKNAGNIVKWVDAEYAFAEIVEEVTMAHYLRARAFNQAFLEAIEFENIHLLRGVGGKKGRDLAWAMNQEGMSRTKFNVDAATLDGWTIERDTAEGFGGGGFLIEKRFEAAEIFMHFELFRAISGALPDETEFLIFGGKKSYLRSMIQFLL